MTLGEPRKQDPAGAGALILEGLIGNLEDLDYFLSGWSFIQDFKKRSDMIWLTLLLESLFVQDHTAHAWLSLDSINCWIHTINCGSEENLERNMFTEFWRNLKSDFRLVKPLICYLKSFSVISANYIWSFSLNLRQRPLYLLRGNAKFFFLVLSVRGFFPALTCVLVC